MSDLILDALNNRFQDRRSLNALLESKPRQAPKSDFIRDALAGIDQALARGTGQREHLPLNGAGVLRAALAGGAGTVNGGSTAAAVESVADVIRRELSGVAGCQDHAG